MTLPLAILLLLVIILVAGGIVLAVGLLLCNILDKESDYDHPRQA